MWYFNDMFHYDMFKAEFVTLVSLKVPSGTFYPRDAHALLDELVPEVDAGPGRRRLRGELGALAHDEVARGDGTGWKTDRNNSCQKKLFILFFSSHLLCGLEGGVGDVKVEADVHVGHGRDVVVPPHVGNPVHEGGLKILPCMH